jgi:hypothetical protein
LDRVENRSISAARERRSPEWRTGDGRTNPALARASATRRVRTAAVVLLGQVDELRMPASSSASTVPRDGRAERRRDARPRAAPGMSQ